MNRKNYVSVTLRILLLNVVIIPNHMTLATIINTGTLTKLILNEVIPVNLPSKDTRNISKLYNESNVDEENDYYQKSVLKNNEKDITIKKNADISKTTNFKMPTLDEILDENVFDDGQWKDLNDDYYNYDYEDVDNSVPSETINYLENNGECNYNPDTDFVLVNDDLINQIIEELPDLIKEGVKNAEKMLDDKHRAIEQMRRENRRLASSPAHGRSYSPSAITNQLGVCRGFAMVETAKVIVQKFNIPKDKTAAILSMIDVTPFQDQFKTRFCEVEENPNSDSCHEDQPYRSISGICNNLQSLNLGASFMPFARFLPPKYDDGFNSMRGESSMHLPNPRTVSRAVADILTNPSTDIHLTQMLKAWGQFTDHDLTFTLEGHEQCCETQTEDPDVTTSECRPIDVQNDSFFSENGVRCLRFIRNVPIAMESEIGPREQINTLTAFIDSSNIYGSTAEEAEQLRAHEDGKLAENARGEAGSCVNEHHCSFPFLPERPMTNMTHYYHAGDERVNEQPGLIAMHTLMFRFHNKLAEELERRHPNEDQFHDVVYDDILFEETRRIVIACVQHITYNEFLPLLLGKEFVEKYKLSSSDDYEYDENLDPSIRNEFATFALRMGHTLIGKSITGRRTIPLETGFFRPHMTLNDSDLSPSDILKGECTNPSERYDMEIVDAVVDKLFVNVLFEHGSDLVAINIQRGRDHGLPPYNEVRKFCCKKAFTSFDEMKEELNPEAVEVFRSLYDSVDDVDVFPGAIAELRTSFGFIGDTLSCILASQFRITKHGDRYWYENLEQPHPFTPEQLSAIKNVTLSFVICYASNIESIQPYPMLSRNLIGNHERNCSDIVESFFARIGDVF